MKLKKLIGGTALALTLALGAGAGLLANKEVSQVKADGVPSTIYFDWSNSGWGSWQGCSVENLYAHFVDADGNGLTTWHGNLMDEKVITSGVTYGKFTVPENSVKVVFNIVVEGWTYDDYNHQTNDIVIATDGNDCFTATTRDASTGWKWDGSWSTYGTSKVSITKTAVEFDGGGVATGKTWDFGTFTIDEGSTLDVPANPDPTNLEHFEGWYSDAECTVDYVSTQFDADGVIYAKFTLLSVDSYFYWTDKDSTALTNVYFWGEYAPEAWPGVAVSNYLVSDVLSYRDQGKLYKIPCPSTGDFKVILNGDGQTGDIVVTPKCLVYTYNNEGWGYSVVDGAAADLVARIETVRNEVRASGSILDYSVCGIAPSDAQAFYNEYYAMDADTKSGVDSSCTYTYEGSYDGEHVPSETTIYFYHIMLSLKKIAEDAGLEVSGSSGRIVLNPNNNVSLDSTGLIAIVSIIALVSISSVVVLLIIKKRKHN